MIGKLRAKLILSAMLSLIGVLTVLVTAIGLLNYRQVVSNADITLSILAENNGRFPETYDEWARNEFLNSMELPYESRYFYVVMDEDGEVFSVDTEQISAVDDSTAEEYARNVWQEGNAKGFIGDYRYVMIEIGMESDSEPAAETYIIFLDCGRSLSMVKSYVITSIGVSAAGLMAVLILLILISGRMVRPFRDNYEKQKRFITDAGHELKTPLAIINADAEVLEMDYGENEWLEDIRKQTGALTELTNSLIALSRMEEGQSKAVMMEFSLSELAEKAVHSFHNLAKAQDKTLEYDIQPGLMMRGDENQVARLVNILLDNAVKYSEQKGRISLTLKKQRNHLRMDVYNTTPSIARDSLSHLFDRFYRTDQSRNSETGGYGLGLSIASSIVNAHKGKIIAATEDERSLLITVTLPY
ncbi:MAG: HAMP domain-containing histidine kinase [Clostridiales bacterium]|nr:HAMP domain-containing histidine kinase [Clostridiales bacterium]